MTTYKVGDEVEVHGIARIGEAMSWMRATVVSRMYSNSVRVVFRNSGREHVAALRNVRRYVEPGRAHYTISPYHVGHPTSE